MKYQTLIEETERILIRHQDYLTSVKDEMESIEKKYNIVKESFTNQLDRVNKLTDELAELKSL